MIFERFQRGEHTDGARVRPRPGDRRRARAPDARRAQAARRATRRPASQTAPASCSYCRMRDLPPGPREPAALQTVEWIVRPTALLRRAQARYGEPFTLRTAWMRRAARPDVSDPQRDQAHLRRAARRPAGRRQLRVPGAVHRPQQRPDPARRRAPAPAPADAPALPRRGAQALGGHRRRDHPRESSTPGARASAVKTLPRMQKITLEVIQRVIFGSRDPELRDALRAALDITGSTPSLIAMSLFGPHRRFTQAVARIDALVYARIDAAGDGDSILDMLKALRRDPRGAARPARDAARRRPRDDRDRARLGAGAPRPPPAHRLVSRRPHRRRVKEVLRTRPVLSITARKTLQPYPLRRLHAAGGRLRRRLPVPRPPPRGHHLRPARDAPDEPTASSRSAAARAAASAPRSRCWRCGRSSVRCTQRFTLAPDRPQGERMRRRSVVLAPSRQGSIIPDNPLA